MIAVRRYSTARVYRNQQRQTTMMLLLFCSIAAFLFCETSGWATFIVPSSRSPSSSSSIRSWSTVQTASTRRNPETGLARTGLSSSRENSKLYTAKESSAEDVGGSSASDAEPKRVVKYDLGIGKNPVPVYSGTVTNGEHRLEKGDSDDTDRYNITQKYWNVAEPVKKPKIATVPSASTAADDRRNGAAPPAAAVPPATITKTRRMIPKDEKSEKFRKALWDEHHYSKKGDQVASQRRAALAADASAIGSGSTFPIPKPTKFYPDIDLSIPESVYSDDGSIDYVWYLLRYEAYEQATREPLLVSFLHSTILNHKSLESSLAFLLANRLQSPAMMISTQLQSIILDALASDPVFRRSLRADMMAVRDRDPACNYLPDVFLYFKGFHALQSQRVAHHLWHQGKEVLAKYLQSQVSQIFQIDIHPNATLGSGIMLDHGTGIVIGETATVGHNCSILHHVTLGGSGKKGVLRHPQIGNGVLLGAGATVLGPVTIGDGTQVGAGTLVISDLPAHCVAVGVPARIIGSFVDVTQQPSIGMDQMMDDRQKIITFEMENI